MANQQPLESVQILWNLKSIQQFIGTSGCLQDYTDDLLTLDLGSHWLTSSNITKQSFPASSAKNEQHNDKAQENITSSSGMVKEDGRSNQDTIDLSELTHQTEAVVSVTTLGLLLLSNLTYQRGSQILKESIMKLILESYSKSGFQEQLQKLSNLKKIDLDGVQSFANFCIAHCLLCDRDGNVLKDIGILRAWSDVVQPLRILIESLLIDHIEESKTWKLAFPEPNNVSSVKQSLSNQKAAIYARFDSYDFANDKRYQAGVQQIIKQLQAEGGGHNTNQKDLELQAKVFYFSRQVWAVPKMIGTSTFKTIETYADDGGQKILNFDVTIPYNHETLKKTKSKCGKCYQVILSHSKTEPSVLFFHKVTREDYQIWLAHNKDTDSKSTSRKPVSQDENLTEESPPTSNPLKSAQPAPTSQTDQATIQDTMSSSKTLSSVSLTDQGERSSDGLAAPNSPSQQHGASSLPFTSNQLSQSSTTDSNAQEFTSDLQPVTSDPPPYPASFLEILQLVESGQEIPGLEILDIQPTNAPPTESQMKPVTKPWLK